MSSSTMDSSRPTLLGIASILLWSTTIAFSRSLTEQLGTLTAAMSIYLFAGGFGLLYSLVLSREHQAFSAFPRRYLWGCGGLFVTYICALYLAIGLAVNREQVIIIGLINYLWPAFSLAFSIPLLHKRATPLLWIGILIAFSGILFATFSTSGAPASMSIGKVTSLLPYGLALGAAICWGLYSNLSRRWAGENNGGAVPLFLLASGAVLACFRLFHPELPHWTGPAVIQLLYMAVFPAMLAYIFWDIAVRKGNITLLSSLSYLTPLLSTLASCIVLRILPGPGLWIGAAFIMLGALLCNVSIKSPEISH